MSHFICRTTLAPLHLVITCCSLVCSALIGVSGCTQPVPFTASPIGVEQAQRQLPYTVSLDFLLVSIEKPYKVPVSTMQNYLEEVLAERRSFRSVRLIPGNRYDLGLYVILQEFTGKFTGLGCACQLRLHAELYGGNGNPIAVYEAEGRAKRSLSGCDEAPSLAASMAMIDICDMIEDDHARGSIMPATLRWDPASVRSTLNALTESLDSVDPRFRKEAVLSLEEYITGGSLEADSSAVHGMVRRFTDPDAQIAAAAAEALFSIGTASSQAVAQLFEVLEGTSDTETRFEVALVLARIADWPGTQRRAEICVALDPVLQEASSSVFAGQRAGAIKYLGRFLSAGLLGLRPDLVNLMLGRLADTTESVRESALLALAALGPNEPTIIEALISLLEQTGTPRSGVVLARTLGEIGPAARAAIPVLVESFAGCAYSREYQDWEVPELSRQMGRYVKIESQRTVTSRYSPSVAGIHQRTETHSTTTVVATICAAGYALHRITGADLGCDQAAWRDWWERQ